MPSSSSQVATIHALFSVNSKNLKDAKNGHRAAADDLERKAGDFSRDVFSFCNAQNERLSFKTHETQVYKLNCQGEERVTSFLVLTHRSDRRETTRNGKTRVSFGFERTWITL